MEPLELEHLLMHSTNCKRQRLTFIQSVPLLSFIALTLCCSNDRYFQQEVLTVRQRLQDQSNGLAQLATPEREGNSLHTSWEFQSERPPAGFLDWAASQLAQGYHVTSKTALTEDLVKEAQGDAVYLKLKVSPGPSGSIVECALQATPD